IPRTTGRRGRDSGPDRGVLGPADGQQRPVRPGADGPPPAQRAGPHLRAGPAGPVRHAGHLRRGRQFLVTGRAGGDGPATGRAPDLHPGGLALPRRRGARDPGDRADQVLGRGRGGSGTRRQRADGLALTGAMAPCTGHNRCDGPPYRLGGGPYAVSEWLALVVGTVVRGRPASGLPSTSLNGTDGTSVPLGRQRCSIGVALLEGADRRREPGVAATT